MSIRSQRNKSTLNAGQLEIKPHVLESKVSINTDFMGLSNGFKKVFTDNKGDRKMVIPIAGYGGHRRGENCANFFGKSFRESSI